MKEIQDALATPIAQRIARSAASPTRQSAQESQGADQAIYTKTVEEMVETIVIKVILTKQKLTREGRSMQDTVV